MKTKLFLLLLVISSYTFAQNWNQVGTAQFTDNASSASMAFDNNGTPYIVYTKANTSNKAYVKTFNGVSWVDILIPEVATAAAYNVAIKFDPSTNILYVTFNKTNNKIDCYKFNGTSWSSVFTNADPGFPLANEKLQIQFNGSSTIRVAAKRTDQKLAIIERNASGAGPNHIENLYSNPTGSTHFYRYDFTSFSKYYLSFESSFNNSRVSRKLVGSSANIHDFTLPINVSTMKYISGIADENYLAALDYKGTNNPPTRNVKVYKGTTNILTTPFTEGILKFRKNTSNNRLYLMYADENHNLSFKKYNKTSSTWLNLTSIGLNTSGSNFFTDMEINPVDNYIYTYYLDNGKISVKKYLPPNTPRIYVNAAATGNNDGSSWTDAYTNLGTTLINLNGSETEIWVAAGTYKPHTTLRTKAFTIDVNNLTIYGGFVGTEVNVSDRDISLIHTTNETILDGDLDSDDDTNITFNNTTRDDNSLRIVQINANNITIDGVTISNGYANDTAGEGRFGAGLETDDSVEVFTIKNSIIKNNVARFGAGLMFSPSNDTNYTIEACIFDNNLATYAAGFYILPRAYAKPIFILSNSLFKNNKTDTYSTFNGAGASAGMIRVHYAGTSVTPSIINNTFVNNSNFGTSTTSDFPTIAFSKTNGSIMTFNIANNIFWNNKKGSSAAPLVSLAYGKALEGFADNFIHVYNSIDEDNYSNLSFITPSVLHNTSNANPLFTDINNNDFTLQSSSPAKDTGDNTYVTAANALDLLGNARIYNNTVDMGCYEFDSAAVNAINDYENDIISKIYPNPVKDVINIELLDNEIKNIEIYNILGAKMLESSKTKINVSNLATGAYFIKITTENGESITKRFLKK